MSISSIGSYMSENLSQTKGTKDTKKSDTIEKEAVNKEAAKYEETKAAVVEKSKEKATATYTKKASSKVDTATIERLKKDAEQRTEQLRSIVEKLLTKQGKTYSNAMDIFSLIKNGEVQVDDETRAQAQKDIAEDGYWGVEQTSERLFSFATALAGNDPEQADKMVEAFKKGYAAAEKQWGGELPEICKKTYDAFIKKMDDWKNASREQTNEQTEKQTVK